VCQVGGSLAGLMHGVYFKRHGSDVVILEQDPSELRSSHQAGIAFGPAVEEFLRMYDHTGVQSRSPPIATRLAYRKRKDIKRLSIVRHETSWGLLYRVLRANFDGLASDAVPNPPPVRDGDGRAQYLAGRRVTGLEHNRGDQVVSVRFVDQDGKEGSLTADLVIGADGGNSTVRTLLQAPTIRGYSGYVAWRGTVPEKDVSPETARYFADFSTLTLLGDTYFVWY
jgi:2-polyprenyl-6-methoxyphenol hydroxylase-like FAD-dependent oxidoreductase